MRLVKELNPNRPKRKEKWVIYGLVFIVISAFLIYTLIAKVQHIKTEEATYQKLVVQKNELKKKKQNFQKK